MSNPLSIQPIAKTGNIPAAPGVLYGVYPDCVHCSFEKIVKTVTSFA